MEHLERLRCKFFLLLLTLCQAAAADVPVHQVEVVNTYPHDPAAFTQGLVFHDGELFEGTGRNGESSVRRVDLQSGAILQKRNLGSRYFGEGITILNGRIYQLTWQSHLGFVYDLASFEQVRTFFLPGEGWGLTHDGDHLIVSDGSATLRFLDPETLKEVATLQVTENGAHRDRLNELEFIEGEIWANVWYEDFIVKINPETGEVTGRLDLSRLNRQRSREDVLNGIAYDGVNKRIFVTGKLWPELYEIRVRE